MTKVALLSGGKSNEREISLKSGSSVKVALKEAGYEVISLDPINDPATYLDDFKNCDVVFPVLHGKYGEDGVIQKFLAENNIKFVGSGSVASDLCFDKYKYYLFLKNRNILMPETYLVNKDEYLKLKLKSYPHVVKPNDGGSSIDTFIIREPGSFNFDQALNAFNKYSQMLVQSLIEGIELTVAIVGEESLPVIEIIPPKDKEFDYENKYNGETSELCPPKNISLGLQKKAQELALEVHKLVNCRHISRSDFILTKDNKLYLLETNTIPGLTNQSLVPKAAFQVGMTMPILCKKLVEFALKS